MIINSAGGGGAGLNFKVIGGVLRPSGGGGDTLTWDGNTEGLTNLSGMYFNVSTACPTLEELQNGGTITLLSIDDEEQTITFTKDSVAEQDGALSIQDENGLYVMVVPENIAPLAGFEAGLYFMDGRSIGYPRLTSLTINGYTGFGGGAPIKENTIWVNTAAEVTGWVFSPTQPTGSEGLVWIETGEKSQTPFNALKKNAIAINPVSAKQYVNGAWVDKTAKIYQGGAWVGFAVYLYNAGDLCTAVTGGWRTSGVKAGEYWTAKAPTATYNAANVVVKMACNSGNDVSGVFVTTNKIDLSDVKQIVFRGSAEYSNGEKARARLVVMDTVSTSSFATAAQLMGIADGSALDVTALTGSYYVGFFAAANYNNVGDTVITCEALYMMG